MKIAIYNFNKILNFCTAKEIDVILLLASMQNKQGDVIGVTWQQVCEEVGICRSYFYKTLYQLEEYGIIEIAYTNEDYGMWKVRLKDNVFAKKDDYKKGYFKINRKVLFSKDFRELNRTEKVILLKLLFMQDKKGHKFKIFIETLVRWTEKSERTIRRAIEHLSELRLISLIKDLGNGFSFGAKEKELGGGKAVENERLPYLKQLIGYVLRKKRIQAEQKDIEDTIQVLKNCKQDIEEYYIQKLYRCIEDCGRLQGAYINAMVR